MSLAMLSHSIKYAESSDRNLWDDYVRKRPDRSLFHLYGWREVIRNTYGHATYYLMLTTCSAGTHARAECRADSAETVLGVLPVAHLKHALFGNCLVSLPFMDGGGILADSGEAEETLLSEVVRLGRRIRASRIELRHERLLGIFDDLSASRSVSSRHRLQVVTRSNKVRMLLDLPDSSEMLMKSFKSKLRSQISRPLKEGLISKTGGAELLEDFYRVFLVNMRDLGSPVHSMKLMRNVLREFSERSRIIAIYKANEVVAAAIVVGSDNVLRNPWASSLHKYASLSPNMLLYFRMLEFACDNGYRTFDFGRSTKGEGTYRFKEQWGAVPASLYWQYISLDGTLPNPDSGGREKFEAATRYWKALPVVVTKILGPRIRKHISL